MPAPTTRAGPRAPFVGVCPRTLAQPTGHAVRLVEAFRESFSARVWSVTVVRGRLLTPRVEHPSKEKTKRDLQRPNGGRERRWEWWQQWRHLISFCVGCVSTRESVFFFQPDQASGDVLSMARTCPYSRRRWGTFASSMSSSTSWRPVSDADSGGGG